MLTAQARRSPAAVCSASRRTRRTCFARMGSSSFSTTSRSRVELAMSTARRPGEGARLAVARSSDAALHGAQAEALARACDEAARRGNSRPTTQIPIDADNPQVVQKRRKAFVRKWRDKCEAVATRLVEDGDQLFTFTRLLVAQWKSWRRITNVVDAACMWHVSSRRIKTQGVLPSAETAAMQDLGAACVRTDSCAERSSGWMSIARPLDESIDVAAMTSYGDAAGDALTKRPPLSGTAPAKRRSVTASC